MRRSAGILLFRHSGDRLEVFLVHPGGPFWAKKDAGAWSIPKGEFVEGEDPLAAAKREFAEETGVAAEGKFLPLGELTQAGGKRVIAWALEGDLDASTIHSNTFRMEWPPKSGKVRDFPEVDAAEWFTIESAQSKVLKGQVEFLERLVDLVSGSG